jgi:hypothetical protein
MSRPNLIGCALALILCWASLAFAQDPPPLEAPGSEPESPKASTSRPNSRATTPAPAPNAATRPNPPATAPASAAPLTRANQPVSPGSPVRPMLVIPGVTGPGNRPRGADRSAIPQSSRPPKAAGAARRESPPVFSTPSQSQSPFRAAPGQSAARPGHDPIDEPIPMTIEALEDLQDSGATPRSSTTPNATPERSRAGSSRGQQASRSGNSADDRPAASSRPRPAPRLLPGMLGRILQPQPSQNRDRAESKNSAEKARPKAATETEAVTDASVKRKIETQIRDTLGDRVRSVEVRVSGRNILIVARATRFWQRRTVRRALETLPALDGYRARIDLDD